MDFINIRHVGKDGNLKENRRGKQILGEVNIGGSGCDSVHDYYSFLV